MANGDGKESIDAASQSANALADILKNVDSQIVSLIGNLTKAGDAAKTNFASAADGAANLNAILTSLPSELEEWDKQMRSTSGEFTRFIDTALNEFTRFGRFFLGKNMFESFGKDAKEQFETVGEGVSGMTDVLRKLRVPDSAVSLIETLSKTAEGGQKAEAGFYAMLAASGQLDTAFDAQTNTLKDLNAMVANYTVRLANVADATNQSVKQVIEFANNLGKIPGIMDGTVRAGADLGDEMDATTAALRLMSGTGQQASEVIAEFAKAQQELGNVTGDVTDSSQKAANFIAVMSEVSKRANLSFADSRAFLEGVADQFRFVSDNTDAAARVMDSFSRALRDTGLTAKASSEIVSDMVKQVTQLNLGTKAFISLRSGGPGGLQGAFRYEELIRQGRLDEVVNMMQRAFRQQAGGRIYTLEEAAASPQAAAQFARQRALLQSGVFGIGRGASDEQANRILEALKAGNVNILKDDIKTGQDAVKEVTERGAQVQERSNQVLNQMSRNVERTAVAAELTAAAEVRRSFGTDPNSRLVDTVRKQMEDAQVGARAAVGAEVVPGTGEEERAALDVHAETIKQAGKDIATGARDMGQHIIAAARQAPRGAAAPRAAAPPVPLPTPTIPMHPGPRPDARALAAAATERGAEHEARVRQARQTAEETRQQQEQQAQQRDQNVKLQIEVTAPQGYGVNVKSDTASAVVTRKSMNPAVYGQSGDPGY
jgi:ABC-type transporter Mla subunit MlaD